VHLNTGIRCWGLGTSGRLGYANLDSVGYDTTPASVGNVDIGGTVTQMTAGSGFTCALLEGGTVRCWGASDSGQLGYGSIESIGNDETPAAQGDVDIDAVVVEVRAGWFHTCVRLQSGDVRCWGYNYYGQLGYGNQNNLGDKQGETPNTFANVDVGGPVTQLAAGRLHTCALLEAGTVRCWGDNTYGQLGYGNTINIGDTEPPASVDPVDIGDIVVALTAGAEHTCALLQGGNVRCWGRGRDGRLGYGNIDNIGDNETPASVGTVEIGKPAIQVAAGERYTCALLDTGSVRCWGLGTAGVLGYGNLDNIGDDELPASAGDVKIGGAVVHLSTHTGHTCAVLETGTVRCWGAGVYGALGYGNFDDIGDDETPADAGDVPCLLPLP